MSDLYHRIETLCMNKGVNITTMCKESGVPRSVMTELKMGRSTELSAKTMMKIASYFDVPIEYIMNGGGTVNATGDVSVTNGAAIIGSQRQATAHVSNGLTEIEEAIMEEVKKLSPKDKIKVYNFITELEG